MNARALTVVVAACLAMMQAPAWSAQKSAPRSSTSGSKWGGKTYKWVDENGITHYGDSVPAESAPQGRSELNSQGVEVNQVPKQLTGTEADKAQQAAMQKAKSRQHDSFLMTTYTSAKDIEQLRDERLALVNGQMDIARGSVDSTNQRLATIEVRMRSFKPWSASPAARRLPDQLVEEVVRTLNERNSLQGTLNSREQEKKEMRAQFDADLTRYRELTDGPRPAAPAGEAPITDYRSQPAKPR
ncbi:MAG: DUF4124 domain-containing protein [Pseudomonadota bacterium]